MKKVVKCFLFFPMLYLFSCADPGGRDTGEAPAPVRMIPVKTMESAEEVKGFGSLSFVKKFELISPAEGVLEKLNFREGDKVGTGEVVGLLKNPLINLAAGRAGDVHSQALAALDIASARLREKEFEIEARLLENVKSREKLIQAEKVFDEERRKYLNREALYEAGGLSDETIREERFRLAQAEAELRFMEKELEIRQVGLRESDLAAAGFEIPPEKDELRKSLIMMAASPLRAELAAAVANLEAAARELEAAKLTENDLVIKSPGAGIIGARYVEEGERLKRDDQIVTILDTESLYAIFPVPEAEALKLKKGMTAEICSRGDKVYSGKVDLVAPQADNQSFTFLVRVIIAPDDEFPLYPGMFTRVSIPLDTPRKITVIPEAALAARKDNSGKVFTVQMGENPARREQVRAEKSSGNYFLSERDVILGSLLGEEREIVSGLVPGEVVVLGPGPGLREGTYVVSAE